MWVFTQDGFVSAVENSDKPGEMVVRSRDRASLELLSDLTGSEIVELQHRDYEYRVFVTKQDFANWLVSHVEEIDYSNFKNRLWRTRGDVYHDAANEVWGTMLSVSDKYPVKSRR